MCLKSLNNFQARIVPKCKESTKSNYFIEDDYVIHDVFHLDARAAERMRGFVAIFILVPVYWIQRSSLIRKETKSLDILFIYQKFIFELERAKGVTRWTMKNIPANIHFRDDYLPENVFVHICSAKCKSQNPCLGITDFKVLKHI